jgi:hypothetical protein
MLAELQSESGRSTDPYLRLEKMSICQTDECADRRHTLIAALPATAQTPATAQPQRIVTSFNDALRCMDQQFAFRHPRCERDAQDIPDRRARFLRAPGT